MTGPMPLPNSNSDRRLCHALRALRPTAIPTAAAPADEPTSDEPVVKCAIFGAGGHARRAHAAMGARQAIAMLGLLYVREQVLVIWYILPPRFSIRLYFIFREFFSSAEAEANSVVALPPHPGHCNLASGGTERPCPHRCAPRCCSSQRWPEPRTFKHQLPQQASSVPSPMQRR